MDEALCVVIFLDQRQLLPFSVTEWTRMLDHSSICGEGSAGGKERQRGKIHALPTFNSKNEEEITGGKLVLLPTTLTTTTTATCSSTTINNNAAVITLRGKNFLV
ncbi:hypothetical protein E2C01_099073 [Portunus trituberculatus]|uniref:Uncharacterized protein n=1 Tax=Portunus trituberculatus TaxID=210409 RepID=A0A5B7KFU8_PORTR|nr:hypothetical protein [Portunus trituberculatus]